MTSHAAVRQQHRLAAALVAPALAMLGLFTFYPVLGSLWLSLHGSVASLPAHGEPFVGLGNYRELAAIPVFWRSLETTLIFVAVILLVGVWIAGETQSGTSVRRSLAGPLARAEIAFGSVGLFVLALVWWGPTPQARRWFLVLALAIILAIGVEALRRQSARESAAASDD